MKRGKNKGNNNKREKRKESIDKEDYWVKKKGGCKEEMWH